MGKGKNRGWALLCLLLAALCLLVACGASALPSSSEEEQDPPSLSETGVVTEGEEPQDPSPESSQGSPEISLGESSAIQGGETPSSPVSSLPTPSSEKISSSSGTGLPPSSSAPTSASSIRVTVSVTCRKAVEVSSPVAVQLYPDGTIVPATEITLPAGATALDALQTVCEEKGVLLRVKNGSYVEAIGGLGEKDVGGMSGWLYGVNGIKPSIAASGYRLQDGDRILWGYTVDAYTM